MKNLLAGISCVLFLLVATTCGAAMEWKTQDIAGHLPDLSFSLRSDQGKPLTEADTAGQVVLLYFGFTACGSQCPMTMSRLAGALARLGPEASHVRVLFVTVDPARDTPEKLRDYVAAFDAAHMTGLTGDARDVTALAKRYRIAVDGDGGPDHLSHSAAVFVFDKQGQARLLVTPEDSEAALVHDLRQLAG